MQRPTWVLTALSALSALVIALHCTVETRRALGGLWSCHGHGLGALSTAPATDCVPTFPPSALGHDADKLAHRARVKVKGGSAVARQLRQERHFVSFSVFLPAVAATDPDRENKWTALHRLSFLDGTTRHQDDRATRPRDCAAASPRYDENGRAADQTRRRTGARQGDAPC